MMMMRHMRLVKGKESVWHGSNHGTTDVRRQTTTIFLFYLVLFWSRTRNVCKCIGLSFYGFGFGFYHHHIISRFSHLFWMTWMVNQWIIINTKMECNLLVLYNDVIYTRTVWLPFRLRRFKLIDLNCNICGGEFECLYDMCV